MKYAIKTLNPDKNYVRWEIHKVDCKDLPKKNGMEVFITEAESPEKVIQKDLEDLRENGWTEENFKVMNCTNK